ncbi:MAG: TIGR00153 family protein [Desulfurivibrionaceae bacterium]|nr:TIGR00153 family protein [Desulfobulbales bacterium]MDT8334917.1 TIGR00153 family protein [Desulfurivibrionaceae bacterium]
MSIIQDMFSGSPFGPLVEHTKKVHECVEVVRPLMEALAHENYTELHTLQDKVSRLEYEADLLKQEIRSRLPRRFFLPVDKSELDSFLRNQDKIADRVEDLAVILTIRNTKIHPELIDDFFEFVDQIFQVTGSLLTAAVELNNLAEVSFGGAEARVVLGLIKGLGEEEWKSDRMARRFSKKLYSLEGRLDPISIIFHEKILLALGSIANEAENAGDMLRMMIVK